MRPDLPIFFRQREKELPETLKANLPVYDEVHRDTFILLLPQKLKGIGRLPRFAELLRNQLLQRRDDGVCLHPPKHDAAKIGVNISAELPAGGIVAPGTAAVISLSVRWLFWKLAG